MDIGTIATRYSRALFSLAKDRKLETRVYDDMKMLAESFETEPGLSGVLVNPVIREAEKVKLITTAAGIEVCELFTRFIQLVLKHKRESLLSLIAYIYIGMYRKDKNITRVRFITSVAADETTIAHLKARLQRETGGTIEFIGKTDPALIGGFILLAGNYRVDASYATQLRKIRNQLLESK